MNKPKIPSDLEDDKVLFPKAVELLALWQLVQLLTVHKTTIYSMINEGVLPPPIKVRRSSRWLSTEIEHVRMLWIQGANADTLRSAVKSAVSARN